jgi:hypothetical protein
MRKVEESLASRLSLVIKNNGTGVFSVGGNTVINSSPQSIAVTLHGNEIANYDKGKKQLYLDNCGYATNVTASRLNVILKSFNLPYLAKTKGETTLFINERGEIVGEDKVTLNVNNN